MTISQKPDALNFSGNLSDILLSDLIDPVAMVLSRDSVAILQETYQPYAGNAKIRLRDIIHSLLEIEMPVYEDAVFHQTKGYGTFSITLTSGGDMELFDFVVVKAYLQRNSFDVELFVKQNWLTFQPREKNVEFHDPEWLTCFPLEASTVKIAATFSDASTQTISYLSLEANKLQSVHVQPGEVIGMFAQDPVAFKVWVEVSGQSRQYVQTYYITKTSNCHNNDVFVFENRLGGMDTIRFTGQKKFTDGTETESALFDEFTVEYYAQPSQAIEKNTGFFRSEDDRIFALDFFRSIKKYHLHRGYITRVYLENTTLESSTNALKSYTFIFKYSDRKISYPEIASPPQLLELP